MNESKKWYIIESNGEGTALTTVALTDAEYDVLVSVFQNAGANTFCFDDYAAYTELWLKGFDTKKEAEDAAWAANRMGGKRPEGIKTIGLFK